LQIEPTLIGAEAGGSAHHWGRELTRMGHDVRSMPPSYIKPYVKRSKSDAKDAAACCEGVSRRDMRFVPIKTAEQRAALAVNKTRERLIKQRTMAVDGLRSLLAEFGIVAARGIGRVEDLIDKAKADASLPETVLDLVNVQVAVLAAIETRISALEKKIARAHAQSRESHLIAEVPGVGVIAASAIAASLPDPSAFKSGRDFAAWLGLMPRQTRPAARRRRHQAGQPLHPALARLGGDLAGARRQKTQRRVCRLDRRGSCAKARAARHRGARQQARAYRLGDAVDWRGVPEGELRQGLRNACGRRGRTHARRLRPQERHKQRTNGQRFGCAKAEAPAKEQVSPRILGLGKREQAR
jgi:transposase